MDDNEAVRVAARRLLTTLGATVVEAATVEEGLARARETRPDALLLDLDLPDGDGLEVCTWVRASGDPVLSRVPVIVLTGSDPMVHHVRALEAGRTTSWKSRLRPGSWRRGWATWCVGPAQSGTRRRSRRNSNGTSRRR